MLHLQIITPEKITFDDEVDQVSLPSTTGQITILPNHIPLVTSIEAGELFFKQHQKENMPQRPPISRKPLSNLKLNVAIGEFNIKIRSTKYEIRNKYKCSNLQN